MRKVLSRNSLLVMLFLAAIIEVLFVTSYQFKFTSPMVWFISSLLVCVLTAVLFGTQKVEDLTYDDHLLEKKRLLAIVVPFAIGVMITMPMLQDIITRFPVDPNSSDVIPALQDIYIGRLLEGKDVYVPFSDYGWTIYPNYLPMQWLPYFISEWLEIDYRWTAYLIFLFALSLWLIRLLKKPIHWLEIGMKSLLPFVFLFLFLTYREPSFGYGVELTIVGFYFILSITIFSKSSLTRATGILLPLLSRFSFAFWLVFYAVSIFFRERKQAWGIAAWSFVGILLIYILPFGLKHPTAFLEGVTYYEEVSFGEWSPHPWQDPNDYPYHLRRGASFAIYFYEYASGDLQARFDLAHLFHRLMSIGSAILVGLLFWFWRKKVDFRLWSLVGLKFCLVFFYAFFYLPFFYLYLVPTFMIIPLLFEVSFVKIQRE